MSQISQFPYTPDNIFPAEQFSRISIQFTPDYMLVSTIVSFDNYPIDRRLWSFHHTNLDIDRVVPHNSLYRHRPEKQVTVVQIEVIGYSIFIRIQTFIEIALIIDITFLNIQQSG